MRITTITNRNKTINNNGERAVNEQRNKQTSELQFDSVEFIKVNRSSALKLNEEEEEAEAKEEVKLNVNTKTIETMIETWNAIGSNEEMKNRENAQ